MKRKAPATEAKKPETTAKSEKVRQEYLIVALSGEMRVGSSLRILNVSESEEDVRKKLDSISEANVARVAVLQKKGVYARRPAVIVTPVRENIVKPA